MSKLGEKQRTSLRTSEIALHFFIRNRRLIVGPNLVYSYTLPKFDDLHWYPQPVKEDMVEDILWGYTGLF